MNKIRIVIISDTHGKEFDLKLPQGDILIHAGDMTNNGTIEDVVYFANWLQRQSFKHKIVIAGNHDWCFETIPEKAAKWLKATAPENYNLPIVNNTDNIHYLQDNGIQLTLNNVLLKIWGSPWSRKWGRWAFQYKYANDVIQKWSQIPDNTDILITHGPAYGILDMITHNQNVGCPNLKVQLELIKPKLHISGHIHEAYGETVKNGVQHINASIRSGTYGPNNNPVVIDYYENGDIIFI